MGNEPETPAELLAAENVRTSENLLEVALVHATYRVPIASPDQTAGSVRKALVGGTFESATDVAVLEDRRLVGLLAIERLLAAGDGVAVKEIMDADPPIVAPGTDQERVAWHSVEHGESSVAVVDDSGRFAGLVPPNRMLSVLLSEHDEDLARLGGYAKGSAGARRAAEEPISRRLSHRVPWLLVGLLGAMVSALLVGAFEEDLSEVVLLAFFLPGVVYMSSAVGTQTQTVLVRAFAVGFDMRRFVWPEVVSGILIGAAIAATFYPFALIGWGDGDVALAVGLALFATCSIATLVAMALPLVFQRFGADPAFGAGPVATVIQDLLSIVVYLAIASPIVG